MSILAEHIILIFPTFAAEFLPAEYPSCLKGVLKPGFCSQASVLLPKITLQDAGKGIVHFLRRRLLGRRSPHGGGPLVPGVGVPGKRLLDDVELGVLHGCPEPCGAGRMELKRERETRRRGRARESTEETRATSVRTGMVARTVGRANQEEPRLG